MGLDRNRTPCSPDAPGAVRHPGDRIARSLDVSATRGRLRGLLYSAPRAPAVKLIIRSSVLAAWRRPTEVWITCGPAAGDAARPAGTVVDVLGPGCHGDRRRPARPAQPADVSISTASGGSPWLARAGDYRRCGTVHGCAVNYVVSRLWPAAMRNWLLSRGRARHPGPAGARDVPLSVRAEPDTPVPAGRHSWAPGGVLLCRPCPVGERTRWSAAQISQPMRAHAESGPVGRRGRWSASVASPPPTLHALVPGRPAALQADLQNLVVTNVPRSAGAALRRRRHYAEMFPVSAAGQGHALAIG